VHQSLIMLYFSANLLVGFIFDLRARRRFRETPRIGEVVVFYIVFILIAIPVLFYWGARLLLDWSPRTWVSPPPHLR
jgi:uncharacterized membrane protein YbjE (DUF340 family)